MSIEEDIYAGEFPWLDIIEEIQKSEDSPFLSLTHVYQMSEAENNEQLFATTEKRVYMPSKNICNALNLRKNGNMFNFLAEDGTIGAFSLISTDIPGTFCYLRQDLLKKYLEKKDVIILQFLVGENTLYHLSPEEDLINPCNWQGFQAINVFLGDNIYFVELKHVRVVREQIDQLYGSIEQITSVIKKKLPLPKQISESIITLLQAEQKQKNKKASEEYNALIKQISQNLNQKNNLDDDARFNEYMKSKHNGTDEFIDPIPHDVSIPNEIYIDYLIKAKLVKGDNILKKSRQQVVNNDDLPILESFLKSANLLFSQLVDLWHREKVEWGSLS